MHAATALDLRTTRLARLQQDLAEARPLAAVAGDRLAAMCRNPAASPAALEAAARAALDAAGRLAGVACLLGREV